MSETAHFDPFWMNDPAMSASVAATASAADVARMDLPRITVVTPAFRSGKYIRDTIESVRQQFYPNLEYIVCDSCSDDGTADILAEYDFLDAVIEKDDGQADALDRVFARATGDILTWLNADDIFAPWALLRMALAFRQTGADIVAGQVVLFSEDKALVRHSYGLPDGPLIERELLDLDGMWNTGQYFYQPEVFFTRDIYRRAGGYVSADLHYSMDYELWLRLAGAGAQIVGIGAPITYFRKHDEQKTHAEAAFKAELRQVVETHVPRRHDGPRHAGFTWSNRRPRVAMINDLGFRYGAGIGHRRIAEALRLQHCEVHCFALSQDVNPANQNALRDYEELVLRLDALEPDAVIVGNLHAAERRHVWLSTVLDRWPTFFFLHDFYMLTGRCAYSGGCGKFLDASCDTGCPTSAEYPALAPDRIAPAVALKATLLRHPNARLLANSTYAADIARSALQARGLTPADRMDKVLLTGLGVDPRRFRPADPATVAEGRRRLGLPADRRVLLMPSGDYDDPRKGGGEAWRLLERLPADRFHALVVGNGTLPDGPVRAMVTRVGYQGDLDDLAALFRVTDFVLTASRDETFGQTLVEGALSGSLPVSLGGGGALPELCRAIDGAFAVPAPCPRAQAIDRTADFLREMDGNPAALAQRKLTARLSAENAYSLDALSRRLHLAFKATGLVARNALFPKVDLRLSTDTPPVTVLDASPRATGGTEAVSQADSVQALLRLEQAEAMAAHADGLKQMYKALSLEMIEELRHALPEVQEIYARCADDLYSEQSGAIDRHKDAFVARLQAFKRSRTAAGAAAAPWPVVAERSRGAG